MNRRHFLSDVAALSALTALPHGVLASLDADGISPMPASMWIYLWDIVDEGYDTVFRRLKEHKLTSISLATAYHAGKFLAPHNPKRRVVFLEDGRVYFKPNPKLYQRVKPLVHSLVDHGHTLKKVQQRANDHGLLTRSWVVCCHNTPLGTAYPDITTETALGDRLTHNLCPSNADVRSYLRALVRDVASHGVDGIELEAAQFQGYTHGFHHEREGIALTPALRFLLGLCFCRSCHARAREMKADLTRLQTFTRETLVRFFEDPDAVTDTFNAVDSLPADLFDPFFAWRTEVVASLIEELAHEARNVRLWPMASVDPVAQKLVGMSPRRVAAITSGMLALGYVRDGVALIPLLKAFQDQIGRAALIVGFQVGLPESGGKAEFLDRMKTARDLGVQSFNFYNYGFIPLKRLEWIEEGLR